jgi:hypothetical protein
VTGSDAGFTAADEAGFPVWYFHDYDAPMLSNSPAIKYLGESQLVLMLNREVWVIDIAGNVLFTYELPA